MESQLILLTVYDINGISVHDSYDAVSAHGDYGLNRIGQGGFRVPANSEIMEHLEVGNQVWIRTIGLLTPSLRWHVRTIIINDVVQTDAAAGKFIDVSGTGYEILLDYRRTGSNVFDSDITPVLPAIVAHAPPWTYEVVGAPTAPSRDVYIVSNNHSVLGLLRQAQQQAGDSFFIDPIYRKIYWHSTEVESSGLVFSLNGGTDNPILTIKRTFKGESPITRLTATGAGTGEDALTLSSVALTAPDIAALEADFPGITWGDPLVKTSLEVTGYPIRDGEIKFPYIKPEDDTPAALYRAVYILNQTAGSYFYAQQISRVSYEITTIIEEHLVPLGKTANLQYNNYVIVTPGYDDYVVDENLVMQSVSHTIDKNGIRYSTIVLSNSADEWLDENQKLVKKILELDETSRSTSAPPSGTASVIPVQHHSLLGLTDDDHPQYLRADGGTPLVGNLVVGGVYTVDGVDISVFKTTYDSHIVTYLSHIDDYTAHIGDPSAHHAPVTPNDGISLIGQAVSVDGTVVRTTRNVSTGDGLLGGGTLSTDRVLTVDTSVVRTTRNLTAGDGISGGGTLAFDRAFAVDTTVVRTTRTITAGNGLTGGGTLAADRTVDLDTPGTLSHSGVNAASGNHTHAITASNAPGGTETLLKTDSTGELHLSKFKTDVVTSSLIPAQTDLYDLGSATALWRKGWLSELESILFVENSIQVTGGWWMIPHGSGTLPEDLAAGVTTIDFKIALSVDDFIVLRSSLQVEYIQVSASLGGTSYTVFRDVDGTGSNAWTSGQVFVILGNTGDGRIEFDAQTAGPRMSVFTQGATYNAQTEHVRIGDLTGWGGHSGYGIGIGDSVGNRIVYDGTSLQIIGDGGDITNIDGGNIQTGTVTADQIDADAINGMVITGSTIRTAASGARIEMNPTSIFGTNGTTKQWEALSANGKLTAGAGAVTLDAGGLSFTNGTTYSGSSIDWGSKLSISASLTQSWIESDNPLAISVGLGNSLLIDAPTDILGATEISGPLTVVDAGGLGLYASLNVEGQITSTDLITGNRVTASTYVYATTYVAAGSYISAQGTIHGYGNIIADGGINAGYGSATPVTGEVRLYNGSTLSMQFSFLSGWSRINQSVSYDIYTPRGICAVGGFATYAGAYPSGGDVLYHGDLIKRYGTTNYTVASPPVVPSGWAYSWYNLTWTSANNGVKTLAGVPAGVKYIIARVQCIPSSGGYLSFGKSSGEMDVTLHYTGSGQPVSQSIYCRTYNGTNQVYVSVAGTAAGIHMMVTGYGF